MYCYLSLDVICSRIMSRCIWHLITVTCSRCCMYMPRCKMTAIATLVYKTFHDEKMRVFQVHRIFLKLPSMERAWKTGLKNGMVCQLSDSTPRVNDFLLYQQLFRFLNAHISKRIHGNITNHTIFWTSFLWSFYWM